MTLFRVFEALKSALGYKMMTYLQYLLVMYHEVIFYSRSENKRFHSKKSFFAPDWSEDLTKDSRPWCSILSGFHEVLSKK